jgi:putative endonuclease
MASQKRGTLYTGVTSDLIKRVYEHKQGLTGGFTSRYGCKILVYFEMCIDMPQAIAREKQTNKIRLIESINPAWRDLYGDIT